MGNRQGKKRYLGLIRMHEGTRTEWSRNQRHAENDSSANGKHKVKKWTEKWIVNVFFCAPLTQQCNVSRYLRNTHVQVPRGKLYAKKNPKRDGKESDMSGRIRWMRESWREAFHNAPQHVQDVPLPCCPHHSSSHVPSNTLTLHKHTASLRAEGSISLSAGKAAARITGTQDCNWLSVPKKVGLDYVNRPSF